MADLKTLWESAFGQPPPPGIITAPPSAAGASSNQLAGGLGQQNTGLGQQTPAGNSLGFLGGYSASQNQSMGQAVYKTQAQQYADAQNVSMSGAVSYITPPSPTGILNGSGGAVLTFSDGSVYYIQSGAVGSGAGQEQAPEIEDGTVLHIPGRSGFNGSVSEIRLAIRSPNKERAIAEIDVGGVVLEVSRENISAIVSALLEAGSVRRESE